MEDPWPHPHRDDLYVDEVSYVVRITPDPSGRPESVIEGYVVWWDEVGVGLDEATAIVPGIAWNEKKKYFEPHVARQSFTQVEWGASGYGLEFIVDLANNIATETVMLGLGYVVARLRGRKRRKRPLPSSEDLSSSSEAARRAVSVVFEEQWDELSIIEATCVRSTTVVIVAGRWGRYEATVGQLEETGDPYAHVRRL